jgi:hypothetical protein
MSEIARLRIEIDEVEPAVIRRLEVPVVIRLDDLHFVLQIAIGWQNCHPFEFRVGETAWGLLDRDDPAASPRAAETATLADVVAAADPAVAYPRLVSAQGRCPPADIGGPMGYETFLRAIADPGHLHHEGMIEWDDPDFDPDKVDEAAIRANLANLGKYLGRRKADQH